LTLPRLGNTYLSQSSYSVLSDIFATSVEDNSTNIGEKLPEVLKVVLKSPPPKSDFLLCASWVHVLGVALVALNAINSGASSSEMGRVWKAVWNFLDSTDASTRKATAESLSAISSCFSLELISAAVEDGDNSSVIRKIVSQVTEALDSLPYARAIPELLLIISSIIKHLQSKESESGPTAAEILLLPLIVHIGNMRIMKGFEYREAADGTLSVAMRVLGPEVILEALPLNLVLGDRYALSRFYAFLQR
jgi:ribosomal RNA-processing protein 12